ncbi:MAG: SPOCS domain-containing protein [Anaerovoracaceae bacterium]
MTYEKDIPYYAMVPAREIEEKVIVPVTGNAVYTPVQVTNISEKPKTVITIEEDILVPDTKPDLREILLIDGSALLSSREIDRINKTDDYIGLSGEVELKTLYVPENRQAAGPVIAVQTRVPFKERWHTDIAPGATLIMDCRAEKIEYMVINERKYRVKISLSIAARECIDRKVDIFEGLSGEDLQMLKERAEITSISLRKKDTLTISENLEIKEEGNFESILKQDISVAENYKQITAEKIVINGFIYVNLLYTVTGESTCDSIRQAQERVEFTQFIPIKQQAEGVGSICFDSSGLRVKLVQDEEQGEVFRLEGEIITFAELYTVTERDIIVDGYHREKDFICDFTEERSRVPVATSTGEASVREIISPDAAYGEVEKILYTTGEIVESESRGEQGKVITEGTLQAKMICVSLRNEEEPQIFSIRQGVPFRVVTTVPQMTGGEIISAKTQVRDIWAEKINGKQLEFNATVMVGAEIMREVAFKVLTNPAFEESTSKETMAPVVVYVAGKDDTLWSIAKKFKTSADSVSKLNELEDEGIVQGRKLLIIR